MTDTHNGPIAVSGRLTWSRLTDAIKIDLSIDLWTHWATYWTRSRQYRAYCLRHTALMRALISAGKPCSHCRWPVRDYDQSLTQTGATKALARWAFPPTRTSTRVQPWVTRVNIHTSNPNRPSPRICWLYTVSQKSEPPKHFATATANLHRFKWNFTHTQDDIYFCHRRQIS